ncbi:MAG TPA: acyl-CoA dehydrogenase family protein [Alphaproteobacteria bacterium]|jgi:alkylation response protein AidB-like acyl-CoA dehydrogenase|nr:acyl-CoA dehydrogenase family protein [Alphaproteobacteria bacterium]
MIESSVAIKAKSSEVVSPAEMIARARELAPRLKERAEQAQAERKVPAETIADYHRTGLIRIAQPHRFGGFEMGWDVLCEISQILAAADGSQAWIQRIMADHAQMVSTFPAEAQDDVWATNHQALISAAFDPVGRATRVKGGFRFSGRHGFSSGVDYADWMICGGFIVDGDKLDGPHFFLVPRADATIIDDWHTMGLEGTGSKTFVVKDAFIPEHRRLDGKLAHIGQGPGTAVNKAAVYRTPRGGITSTGFAALAVGMAKGVLEEWLLYTAPRKSRGIAVSDQPGTQMIAAKSSAEIESVEALYFGTITRAMRVLEAGGTLSSFDLATARRNVAFACQVSLKAGTRLFNAGGGRALYRGQGLERQYRNLLGAASHHSAVWDAQATAYGKALLERYAK